MLPAVPRPLHDDHTFDEITMRVASRRSDSDFSDGWCVGVTVEFRNKGAVVFSFRTNTLDAALARAPWEYGTRLEQDAEAFAALEASQDGKCMQPGCAAKAAVRLQVRETLTTGDGAVLAQRANDLPYAYVRDFCTAHADRGDCDMEDNDENYVRREMPPRKAKA